MSVRGSLGDVCGQVGAAFELREDEQQAHGASRLGPVRRLPLESLAD
jgi:hypothetical protein